MADLDADELALFGDESTEKPAILPPDAPANDANAKPPEKKTKAGRPPKKKAVDYSEGELMELRKENEKLYTPEELTGLGPPPAPFIPALVIPPVQGEVQHLYTVPPALTEERVRQIIREEFRKAFA